MFNILIFQSLAMMVTAWIIPGMRVTAFWGAFLTVAAIALMNATIWDPRLFYSLPQNFSSYALSLFFANGVLFWILVKVLPGIEIKGVLPALIAPCVFTLSSLLIHEYFQDVEWVEVAQSIANSVRGFRDVFLERQPGI